MGRTHRLAVRSVLSAAIGCAAAAPASATDNFACTINQPSSTLSYNLDASAPLNGTLRGANTTATPATRTRTPSNGFPGLTGCTTSEPARNDSVGFTGTGSAVGSGSDIHPAGSFNFLMSPADPAVGVASVRGLSLNLLGSSTVTVTANINNFATASSFCTWSPGCSFPALSGLTIPVGNASVTSVTAVQNPGTANGTLTPTALNEWDFAVIVPLVVTPAVTFAGSPLPLAPQNINAALAGHVVRSGNSITLSATVTINIDVADANPVNSGDFPLGTTIPILCTTTFNLILNVNILSSSTSLDTSSTLVAAGNRVPCLADWNGNFVFDIADVFAFLASWFADGPGIDFDNSGGPTIGDIFAFLSAWFMQAC